MRLIQEHRMTAKIDTTSATGRLTFHVFAALAEFERNMIRERTKAGMDAARARGRTGGRKPALSDKQVREVKALMADPHIHESDVAKKYEVSRTTPYTYVSKAD